MSNTATLDQARQGMGARIRVRKLPSTPEGVRLLEGLLGERPSANTSYEVTIDETTLEPLTRLTQRDRRSRRLVVLDSLTNSYAIIIGSQRQGESTQKGADTRSDRKLPSTEQTRRVAQSLVAQFGRRATLLPNGEPAPASSLGDSVIGAITVRPLERLGVVLVSGDIRLDELNRLGAGWVVPSSSLRFEMPKIRVGNRRIQESWHLARLKALGFWKGGKSPVWIGMVDSGLDPDVASREFKGRNPLFAEFRGNDGLFLGQFRESRLDAHGTKMACLAAGLSCGVCPDANLVVASCFSDREPAAPTAVLRAMDWAIERLSEQEGVKILNLSFNFHDSKGKAAATEIFRPVVQDCLSDSIFVVGSIGNSGPGHPGSPGDYREVLGVGAVDQQKRLYEWCSHGYVAGGDPDANRFYKPDFIAPGVDLLTMGNKCKPKEVTGTSASSAVLAGMVGEILRNSATLPATRDDLMRAIRATGVAVEIGRRSHKGECYLIPSQL